jgi:peptidyl-prolyl cis-trans isomerase C
MITSTPTSSIEFETQVPLAAQVNGEEVTLEALKAEIARYQMISGTGLATFSEEKILEDMIDQVLLAQAANNLGFEVDEALLDARIQNLGLSETILDAWMKEYGYSEEDFRQAMRQAIAAAWMMDKIIEDVPETADQVLARQVLLNNSNEAEAVYNQLEDGVEFGTLAAQYDPVTSGDLGWFPRGYLNVSELDDVVFSLEPGLFSDIIQTALGYHIVQVIERDPNHPLSVTTRRVLQVQALADWLETQRLQSEINIMLP